jgi:hypothetical protein
MILKEFVFPHDEILHNTEAATEEVKIYFCIEKSQRKVSNSRQHEQKIYI